MAFSTFCKTLTKSGSGGTLDAPSELGTINLRSDARMIRALIAIATVDKATTVEGVFQRIRITSNDWAWGTADYHFGNSTGNGVATNEENFGVQAMYIPMNAPVKGSAAIDLTYSASGVTVTENMDISAAILYDNGVIPPPYNMALDLGRMGPTKGSVLEVVDNATAATVDFSTAGKKIPSWAKAVVGINCFPIQDGIAVVDDPIISKYTFDSSAPDFRPQEFPGTIGYSGSLGTSIIGTQGLPTWYIPTYIPLTGKPETVTADSILTVANAGNVAHGYSLAYA